MEQLWNYLFHVCPIFSNFTKITGLVQALSTSSFTAVQYSANFRILQIFQFFANFAGFTKIAFLVGVFLTSPFTGFHWFSEFSNFLKMLQFLHCVQTWTDNDTDKHLLEGHLLEWQSWSIYLRVEVIRSFHYYPTAVNNTVDSLLTDTSIRRTPL